MCVEMQIDSKIKGSELFLEPRIGLRRKLLLPQRLWWWPVEAQTPNPSPPPPKSPATSGAPETHGRRCKTQGKGPINANKL